MAKGAAWMGLLRMCVKGISLISTVILARLLVPADFGIIAMATSIIAFLQLATAFSFDIPLIQKQDADRDYFDSAWTLNVVFYGVLAVALVLLAHPAALFYQEDRLTDVIRILAIGFFIQGFENIGVVYFRKELDFRKDFILMLSKRVLGFMVTIPLAFYLRSYWALITGMVISNISGVIITYLLHPFRPRFSLVSARELFHFSKWLMLNNIVNFLRNRSPDFVIGRISGTSSLGLFAVAMEVSTLPTSELVAPINRVVFPGYSKIANDQSRLRQSYVDVLAVIAVVALPAGFGLAAVATPLIDVFLGDKWAGAASIVSILAIYGGLNAIQTNTGSVFNAIGKPHLITLVGVVYMSVLLTASVALALAQGPTGVAIAYLGSTIVMGPITYYLVCRETALRYRDLVAAISPPLLASCLMYVAVSEFDRYLATAGHTGSASRLGILVLSGATIYATMIFVLWIVRGRPRSAEYRLAHFIVQKLTRRTTHSR